MAGTVALFDDKDVTVGRQGANPVAVTTADTRVMLAWKARGSRHYRQITSTLATPLNASYHLPTSPTLLFEERGYVASIILPVPRYLSIPRCLLPCGSRSAVEQGEKAAPPPICPMSTGATLPPGWVSALPVLHSCHSFVPLLLVQPIVRGRESSSADMSPPVAVGGEGFGCVNTGKWSERAANQTPRLIMVGRSMDRHPCTQSQLAKHGTNHRNGWLGAFPSETTRTPRVQAQ